METLDEIFEESVKKHPDKMAFKKGDTTYTYRELKESVNSLANYLKNLGLKEGEAFAVLGENRPEWGIGYLGILKAGCVCVPLDPLLTEGELLHILRESNAGGVVCSESHLYKIESIKGELKHFKYIIKMNDLNNLPPGIEIKNRCNPESLAVLIFTSGTTGTSKAVMLSHRNIISNIKSISRVIPVYPGDTMVSIIPMHHTFEATCGFLYPLSQGVTIYYPPSLRPNELISTMKEANVSCLIAVPLLFEKFLAGVQRKVASASLPTKITFGTLSGIGSIFKFLRKPLFARIRREMGLGNLRLAVSGGAALPEKVARGLELMGIPILQGYGLTEAAPVISVNPPERPKNASVGIPIPDVEVRIAEPDKDGIGEIVVRGPNVMIGYYNNKKATDEVLKDNWLYTGDLGYFDREGYLHITGRKKSIIVTQTGKNIYPEELEELLQKSVWIKEVLVIPRIDPKTKKEEVCALIYPDYEKLEEYSIAKSIKFSEEDIRLLLRSEIEKVNAELPIYKRITRFEIREEEFPKTTTQKIKRHLFIDRGIRV
ncbi:MAG: AMP-dependent synthetase/ligase [candidate division WOR-3 bacterium]